MELVTIEDYKNDIGLLNQYPVKYIKNNGILKLKESESTLIIGTTNRASKQVYTQLDNLHKEKKIIYCRVNSSELTSYLSKSSSINSIYSEKKTELTDLNKLANDAPIINLVNSIIIDGINLGSSDIHIEGYDSEVVLRYRVDGVLVKSENIRKELFSPISSRIKIMANLNIMEKRQPQDGRVSVHLEGVDIDLRISIVPLSTGESIVLRLFVKKNNLVSLEDLGYYGKNLKILKDVINLPYGLILITGPTGSGKTTTLNALLQLLDSSQKKIITIEDPVEYSVPGVNQIQVNNEIDLGFSDILRRVLRQDPDVIMIGEIRDKETAELVIRASLTGHLVLSTLHTNDAASSISRLKDLGVAEYLITSVLKASFAQRLLRTICSKCGGDGCKTCSKTGLKGRIAISEGFVMDETLEALILDNAKPYKIRKHLENSGMKSLYQAGIISANNNKTTMDEVTRVLSC
ncbi:type II/IV secretion system protein [Thiospirochaeta perfilievii]|uniref:Type II/IV secretion system protein n=1 Tax=Thiospirochaeta perfilievii TaxID=252967 RepID=A0A5C1Q9Q2_9SPIO|nr:GspE/PulE family protein [Thiospirochaeta perfilievii]QEN04211.1 type II/IV secretion system protein [Thiospirochaeta perfilievii]